MKVLLHLEKTPLFMFVIADEVVTELIVIFELTKSFNIFCVKIDLTKDRASYPQFLGGWFEPGSAGTENPLIMPHVGSESSQEVKKKNGDTHFYSACYIFMCSFLIVPISQLFLHVAENLSLQLII